MRRDSLEPGQTQRTSERLPFYFFCEPSPYHKRIHKQLIALSLVLCLYAPLAAT